MIVYTVLLRKKLLVRDDLGKDELYSPFTTCSVVKCLIVIPVVKLPGY